MSLDPLHVSSTSHTPRDALQTYPIGRRTSAGQVSLDPLHTSATSHTPRDALHSYPIGRRTSAGQVLLEPPHTSATSQTPREARHTVPTVTKVQLEVQHDPDVPLAAPSSHCSPGLVVPSPQELGGVSTVTRLARPPSSVASQLLSHIGGKLICSSPARFSTPIVPLRLWPLPSSGA